VVDFIFLIIILFILLIILQLFFLHIHGNLDLCYQKKWLRLLFFLIFAVIISFIIFEFLFIDLVNYVFQRFLPLAFSFGIGSNLLHEFLFFLLLFLDEDIDEFLEEVAGTALDDFRDIIGLEEQVCDSQHKQLPFVALLELFRHRKQSCEEFIEVGSIDQEGERLVYVKKHR